MSARVPGCTVSLMKERDPGFDDWFDEPEPPTQESGRGGHAVYDDGADDAWVLPVDEPRRRARRSAGGGDIAFGGVRLTTTQLAIIAAAVLAVFFGILAAFGVFSSNAKTTVPPITTATTLQTQQTTTAVTPPAAAAPTSTLKPLDTGKQVKILQGALNALGFSVGKPDGDYGPKTQSAVEQFQSSKGLTADGIVGPATLNALAQALSG